MTDLAELIERVSRATGPDREIDAAIEVALQPGSELAPSNALALVAGCYWAPASYGMTVHGSEPLTASIDAALALIGAKLPGWCWRVERFAGGATGCDAIVWRQVNWAFKANAPTPALALLAALLTALSQEQPA